jgi:hypothetical protein
MQQDELQKQWIQAIESDDEHERRWSAIEIPAPTENHKHQDPGDDGLAPW